MRFIQHKMTSIFLSCVIGLASIPFSNAGVLPGRFIQAKELLGGTFRDSVSRGNEKNSDVSDFIKVTTLRFLPAKFKKLSSTISRTVIDEANHYELDPIFLMAVIQNESSFNPARVGGAGEIGLMQIKPTTAKWIANLYKIDYRSKDSLFDPKINIRVGAALLDKLRHQFESKSRLYLSAYNIGAHKVREMVSRETTPKEYVRAVMKRYLSFYRGYMFQGSSKEQGELAWQTASQITRMKIIIPNLSKVRTHLVPGLNQSSVREIAEN